MLFQKDWEKDFIESLKEYRVWDCKAKFDDDDFESIRGIYRELKASGKLTEELEGDIENYRRTCDRALSLFPTYKISAYFVSRAEEDLKAKRRDDNRSKCDDLFRDFESQSGFLAIQQLHFWSLNEHRANSIKKMSWDEDELMDYMQNKNFAALVDVTPRALDNPHIDIFDVYPIV